MGMGAIGGPALGGGLASTVGFGPAFVLVAVIAVGGLVTALLLPDLPRKQALSMRAAFAPIPSMIRAREMLLPGIVAFTAAIGIAAIFTIYLADLRGAGWSEQNLGFLVTAFAIGFTVSGFNFARLVRALGQTGAMALGLGGCGALIALASFAGGTLVPLTLMLIIGGLFSLAQGLYPYLTAKVSLPEQRGVAMSVVGLYWAGGNLVGPVSLGVIADAIGAGNAVLIAAGVLALVAINAPLLFRLLSPQETAPLTNSPVA